MEAAEGFQKGQTVWVLSSDGEQRAAVFVGEGENASWFGGPPLAYVVFVDDGKGAEVQLDTVIPRDEE
jgi:hypothetical protein